MTSFDVLPDWLLPARSKSVHGVPDQPVSAHAGMVLTLDHQGCVVAASERWLSTLGYLRHDTVGRSIATYLTEPCRTHFQDVFIPQLQRHGQCYNHELYFVTRDGSLLATLVTGSAAFDLAGRYQAATLMLTDVNELMQRLTQLETQLCETRVCLEQANRRLAAEIHGYRKLEQALLEKSQQGHL